MSFSERAGRKGAALFDDRVHELHRDVQGIAGAAAVAHDEQLVAGGERFGQLAGRPVPGRPRWPRKNFSFISALSRHLRSTASLNCARRVAAMLGRHVRPSPRAIRAVDADVPAVVVIGGAGAFGRNHGGAERRLRRALLAEGGTIERLLEPSQHLAADADRPAPGLDVAPLRKSARRRNRGTRSSSL